MRKSRKILELAAVFDRRVLVVRLLAQRLTFTHRGILVRLGEIALLGVLYRARRLLRGLEKYAQDDERNNQQNKQPENHAQ